MEIIVKIKTEGLAVSRELVCDYCNGNLYTDFYKEDEIYAIFWKERDNLYLEKYICRDCFNRYFKGSQVIPFESAAPIYRKALERDFKRDWHGIIAPCSSLEEWKLLQENPFLIELWGEKF